MPRKTEQSWYRQIADRIVRDGVNIRQAVADANMDITGDEAMGIFKSKPFQAILWQARFDYYTEIASNPSRTKAAVLGLVTLAMQNLASSGEWEKVIEAALKLAKIEGWVGGDSNVNVFANLSAKDIEEAKKRLQDIVKSHDSGADKSAQPTLPN